ncbi:MAG TPA: glycosyltransferase family 4 protein, partial [Desulfobacterales bacterium]|nr:glycosyltransferase family 4 protein [Desulfobacterales bacterium]
TFRLTRRVIAEADKVTAVSNALKVAAEGIVRSQKEIAVVYTGCDLTRFSFNAEARSLLRRELGIAPESFVLIFIGHLLRTKGIFELVDAFRILCRKYHNTHLVFVGEGQDVQTLVAKVSEVGIEGQVHFVGRRPHDEISDWLSAADVLVLPSWHEGLPNVVVEAMACERPVVATKVGGIPEAVADGKSGILVERGDVKALANAIALLAEDPTRRAVMGAAGRQIVEERFTWERNAEKTIQVYREVLGEG